LAKRGVEIERGRALTDLTQDAGTVTARLRGHDGSVETVRCRWVIGCDGAHSTVRKATGIPFAGSTYRVTQYSLTTLAGKGTRSSSIAWNSSWVGSL
jgi:2-polyprenyl-6-methoxyphenol hydroxylase-like FAD-dependent oxidoreductase